MCARVRPLQPAVARFATGPRRRHHGSGSGELRRVGPSATPHTATFRSRQLRGTRGSTGGGAGALRPSPRRDNCPALLLAQKRTLRAQKPDNNICQCAAPAHLQRNGRAVRQDSSKCEPRVHALERTFAPPPLSGPARNSRAAPRTASNERPGAGPPALPKATSQQSSSNASEPAVGSNFSALPSA